MKRHAEKVPDKHVKLRELAAKVATNAPRTYTLEMLRELRNELTKIIGDQWISNASSITL